MTAALVQSTAMLTVIRSSSLSQYPDCPRRWAARNLRDEIEAAGISLKPELRNIGAIVGTAVHKAAAIMLEVKAQTGKLPPPAISNDAAIAAMREEAGNGEIITDRETPSLNDGEQQVLRMAAVYRAELAPEIQPILVEERLEAQVTPSLVVSGMPDTVAREPGKVRDLKGGKRCGNHAPQIGSYSLLARTHGLDIEKASVDWIPRVPLKKPQPGVVRMTVDVATAETAAVSILRHIEGDLRTFREGDPAHGVLPGDPWAFAANPSSILCSPKWCTAFGTAFCREHATQKEQEE